MKKLIMILLLIAGFSAGAYAQIFKKKDNRERSEKNKKWKPRKQMYHFEKQEKDKNLAHNGSNYKKPRQYKVDGDGFAAYDPNKKQGLFSDKNRKQRKMRRMAYAVR